MPRAQLMVRSFEGSTISRPPLSKARENVMRRVSPLRPALEPARICFGRVEFGCVVVEELD